MFDVVVKRHRPLRRSVQYCRNVSFRLRSVIVLCASQVTLLRVPKISISDAIRSFISELELFSCLTHVWRLFP